MPRLNAFVNGAYTITPQEKNGVLTSRGNPFEAEMSISDAYMGRGGFEYLLWPKHGLTLSLAGRIEGVPVRDMVGGSEGFRRPRLPLHGSERSVQEAGALERKEPPRSYP